ncbi:MAG: SCO family protein [Rhizobiales bacterium]|nr:SCO family protein [Hyphomicrobiales bacterium]NRB15946.1 SCO family protein [Hyphomicrobiales bacterium]
MLKSRLIIFLITFIILLIGAGVYVYVNQPKTLVQATTSSLIGGDFTMVDHNGNTVTQDDYKGKKSLVFFGFTNCPAVCPTELYNLASALDEIGPEVAKNINVIFVSIDPEQDTPARMKEYVSAFHEDFIGLTGSVEQVATMAKAFRVYYLKVPLEDSEAGYTMDHSAYTYLMDEDGQFLTHLSANNEINDIVAKIRDFM